MDDIISEDSTRTTGRTAQKNNILAAKIVAETVRTTLGPKGMDKMLVDEAGEVIVTNDGVTILKEMDIQHPAAKMIVEIAKTQESEVGDGTTTAVILAGELLKQAEYLIDKNIHPTIITKGYRIALKESLIILNIIEETSVAAVNACVLIFKGSITPSFQAFIVSPVNTLIPAHFSEDDFKDVKTVIGSKPAFSAKV